MDFTPQQYVNSFDDIRFAKYREYKYNMLRGFLLLYGEDIGEYTPERFAEHFN